MKKPMLAMAAAAFLAPTAAPAQSTEIHGEVVFEDGSAIPKGQIEIYLEDAAVQHDAQSHPAKTHVKSDGGSKMMVFSISSDGHQDLTASTLQVIARLERADGWMLARGSAKPEPGSTIRITLNRVMY